MPGREPIENIKFAFATMRHQPGTSQHHPWIFKSKFGSGLLSGSERGDVCIDTNVLCREFVIIIVSNH